MYEFPCPQPITASIEFAAGSCEIVAEDTDTATVDIAPYSGRDEEAAAAARVEMRGGQLVVDLPERGGWHGRNQPRLQIKVRVPAGSKARVKVASADVTAHGPLAEFVVTSASGDVYAEKVTGDAAVTTASGDIRLDHVGGSLRSNSASGGLSVRTVEADIIAECASGDISIDDAHGSVKASTASGDVRIGVARRGTVGVKSASGDALIGVAAGTKVWLDLSTFSGSTSSDLAVSDDSANTGAELTLRVQTMSGDIDIRRVELADRA